MIRQITALFLVFCLSCVQGTLTYTWVDLPSNKHCQDTYTYILTVTTADAQECETLCDDSTACAGYRFQNSNSQCILVRHCYMSTQSVGTYVSRVKQYTGYQVYFDMGCHDQFYGWGIGTTDLVSQFTTEDCIDKCEVYGCGAVNMDSGSRVCRYQTPDCILGAITNRITYVRIPPTPPTQAPTLSVGAGATFQRETGLGCYDQRSPVVATHTTATVDECEGMCDKTSKCAFTTFDSGACTLYSSCYKNTRGSSTLSGKIASGVETLSIGMLCDPTGRITTKPEVSDAQVCVDICQNIAGCKYMWMDPAGGTCYFHSTCSLDTHAYTSTWTMQDPLPTYTQHAEVLWGTNATGAYSGLSHAVNDKYFLFMRASREVDVYEKDPVTGEYTTYLTTLDNTILPWTVRSIRLGAGESPHFIIGGLDNRFYALFATSLSPLTYTVFNPNLRTDHAQNHEVVGYINEPGTLACFNFVPRVMCYTCNPATGSCTKLSNLVYSLRGTRLTDISGPTSSVQSRYGKSFDVIPVGSDYVIAVAELGTSNVDINYDGALAPDAEGSKAGLSTNFIAMYRYSTTDNTIREYMRIPSPAYTSNTQFGHVTRFTENGAWLFASSSVRAKMYIYRNIGGEVFTLDKTIDLPMNQDHNLYVSPTGSKFAVAYTGRSVGLPYIFEYHYNAAKDSYDLAATYSTDLSASLESLVYAGASIYAGFPNDNNNAGVTLRFDATASQPSPLAVQPTTQPTAQPSPAPRTYVHFPDSSCSIGSFGTLFRASNDKVYTPEECKALCDQYGPFCQGAYRHKTLGACYLVSLCYPVTSTTFDAYLLLPPQVNRIEPSNQTQCFFRHTASTAPGVLAHVQKDSPTDCPAVCAEYPTTKFFQFHDQITYFGLLRPGCVCMEYCSSVHPTGSIMPYYYMDTPAPTHAPTPIDFAPPTQRPTPAPTLEPTPAPTAPIPCTTSTDCAVHDRICTRAGFCEDVPCTAHTDCFADTQVGRLPFCSFRKGECVDPTTSTCTTLRTCESAAKSYATATTSITKTTVQNSIQDPALREETTLQTMQTVRTSEPQATLTVQSNETVQVSLNDTSEASLQLIKEARCGEYADLCTVEVVAARRVLQGGGQELTLFELIISFDVDDAIYESWIQNNQTFTDSAFVTYLATALNVTEQDISVTPTAGEVVVTVSILDESAQGEAIDGTAIDAMNTLQSELNNVTQAFQETYNLTSADIQSTGLNLCGARDCEGRGTCAPETGVCTCASAAYYGVNCELTTLAPTLSPTGAPTLFPTRAPVVAPTYAPTTSTSVRELVSSYTLTLDSFKHAERAQFLQDILTNVSASLPAAFHVGFGATVREVAEIPGAIYNADPDKDYLLSVIKGHRGFFHFSPPVGSYMTWGVQPQGRRLQESTFVNLGVNYTLSEGQYYDLLSFGNEFDSHTFATLIESSLGLSPGSVSINYWNYEVEFEIKLYYDNEDPTDSTYMDQALTLKTLVDAAAADAFASFGVQGADSLTYSSFDVCEDRTATYPGCLSCNSNSGICTCAAGYVGASCNIPLVCENGGVLRTSYCECVYPFYGVFCENTRMCACT